MVKLFRFLFIVFFITSCGNGENTNANYRYSECGIEDKSSIYTLNESYFKEKDTITLNLKIVYFHNLSKDTITVDSFDKRIDMLNSHYKTSKVQFKLTDVKYIYGKPEQDSVSLVSIKMFEKLVKEKRKDIRNKYYMEHYEFWNKVYYEENNIIVYVYGNNDVGFGGIAGGIGSNFLAINSNYLTYDFHTLEHEIGHDLGLYHTHEPDSTNGLNYYTGDMVCDTYTSDENLIDYLDNNCILYKRINIPEEHLKVLTVNLMSYTKYDCRKEFTPVQIMRMRKVIETNADLRNSIVGFNNFNKSLWKNLERVKE